MEGSRHTVGVAEHRNPAVVDILAVAERRSSGRRNWVAAVRRCTLGLGSKTCLRRGCWRGRACRQRGRSRGRDGRGQASRIEQELELEVELRLGVSVVMTDAMGGGSSSCVVLFKNAADGGGRQRFAAQMRSGVGW